MDRTTPLDRTLGDGNAAGRFPWGWGGCRDGRVAPSHVAQFCGEGWRCAWRSISNSRLFDVPTPLDWRLGDRNAGGRFQWGWGLAGMGGLCPAAWRNSVPMGGDAHGNGCLVDVKTPLVWRLGGGKAAGRIRGRGLGRLRPAPWRDSAAMRMAQCRQWPSCVCENAPRLEIL